MLYYASFENLNPKRTKREENYVSDSDTAGSEWLEDRHARKRNSSHDIDGQERDLYSLEVEAEACIHRIPRPITYELRFH